MQDHPNDLVITLTLKAKRADLYRCWTEADLLRQWFMPPPYAVADALIHPHPGGAFNVTVRASGGTVMPMPGVVLEAVPNERLVTTDAYTGGWVPAAKPFKTTIVTFSDEDEGTRYCARIRHWTAQDRAAHLAMGCETGWRRAADQLEALANAL